MGLSATRDQDSLEPLLRARNQVSRREAGLVLGAGRLSKLKERLEAAVMSFHLPWIERVMVVVVWERATVQR